MSYRRGDVVLVLFPNSDLVTFKKRPALVVQDNALSTGLRQTIVALITSNLARTGPTRVVVRKQDPVGRTMGLLADSVIVADNLATVLDREIDKAIGRCAAMAQVDRALKRTLGLN
jgi:mRNA interferase MazF